MTPHDAAHIMQQFLEDVSEEYDRASLLYARLHSAHEAYAVILEELDEFWEHVRQQDARRCHRAMRHELVQIAAMCLRTVLDLGYGMEQKDAHDVADPL
jgi:glutamyl-tRNA reductase